MTTRAQIIESAIERAVLPREQKFVLDILHTGDSDKAERIVRNWIEKNSVGLEQNETKALLQALDSVGAVAPSAEANLQPTLL